MKTQRPSNWNLGRPAIDPDDPRIWTALAHCDAADLNALAVIREFGVKSIIEDAPAQVLSELVGPLLLGGSVVRFEFVHGQRLVNR